MSWNDLDPVLRRAYEESDPELRPDPALRERTLHALQMQGVLVPAQSKRPPMRVVAIAAAAALAGFGIGVGAASRVAPETIRPSSAVAVSGTSFDDVLLEVQRTGSEHARAIERLVAVLDQADGGTLSRAQEVYLAALRASEEQSAAFLTSGAAAARRLRPSTTPVIWF